MDLFISTWWNKMLVDKIICYANMKNVHNCLSYFLIIMITCLNIKL